MKIAVTTAVVFSATTTITTAFIPSHPPFLNSKTPKTTTTTIHQSSTTEQKNTTPLSNYDLTSPACNVPPTIASKVGTNLHLQTNHPLHIIKQKIETYFQQQQQHEQQEQFDIHDDLSPVVSTQSNFDDLLIPPDHPSRSKSDTYYINDDLVLRTHTSAHQTMHLREGGDRFLVSGDVYRRDEIDSSHYPIFHQMEGVRMFTNDELESESGSGKQVEDMTEEEKILIVQNDLKSKLEGLAFELFGNVKTRWRDDYFPFTDPSFELDVFFDGDWMEVLGCGVIQRPIIRNCGRGDQLGWAFGLGLERLAMVLFEIPDIRLFWSNDERFVSQFESGEIVKFEPYSKYPPCLKDISFWLADGFHPNDLAEKVRDIAGDLVEKVELIDEFTNGKTGRTSNAYRITYRSMDRSLTNEEINQMQEEVRVAVSDQLGCEVR